MANPYGVVIKRLREERDWNQQELADAAQVNRETVVRAEQSGNVGVWKLLQIAAVLDVTLSELFGGVVMTVEVSGPEWWGRLTLGQRQWFEKLARRALSEGRDGDTPPITSE